MWQTAVAGATGNYCRRPGLRRSSTVIPRLPTANYVRLILTDGIRNARCSGDAFPPPLADLNLEWRIPDRAGIGLPRSLGQHQRARSLDRWLCRPTAQRHSC
ncbi:MAG: hypothetical protein MZV63_27265 [Marinilabiliales bacterium]|nr:hypothetical protein [Marinilabiliales bacterium]